MVFRSTDKKLLESIFKKWQIPLIEKILDGQPITSRTAYKFLEERDIRTIGKGTKSRDSTTSVSRASVINFLNYMVDQDILNYTVESGKGGHHRIYSMTLTREAFAWKIMSKFFDKLLEAFPESENFPWPVP